MSVLVYIDTTNGNVSKNSLEAIYYGSKIGNTTVISNGSIAESNLAVLGEYGASKVLLNSQLAYNDPSVISKYVQEGVKNTGATTVVISYDFFGKALAPRVSAGLKAGLVAGAIALPDANGNIKINVFSGKAKADVKVNTPVKVIGLTPNSLAPEKGSGSASVESFTPALPSSKIKSLGVEKQEGDILLTEAELVVSAGRGLKGPENWGMVEDLAKTLGAATACSRPVADIGWRPHHEHVGQTGYAIRPNLYIAAGISGAIQHLAGVNQSKVIVVINTDPEAPFFKAADYGVVGDAFEVLPKLNESLKKFKAQN